MFKFFLSVIAIFQFVNVKEVFSGYENYVAFKCGRPTMVFLNNKWIVDFQQSCIKDEMGIVSYCQRTFSSKNISSAEPAMEKLNFTKWCDFENKNCAFNVQVRPFKCLETNSQSDALVLPKNCLFAHLGVKSDCKIYTNWVIDAKVECSKKTNFEVRSYGMLFQCGKSPNSIRPMYFRGVEFVCCPIERKKVETKIDKVTEQNVYKDYLKNGILQSENGENEIYKGTLGKLDQSEREMKNNIINDYKHGQNDLKKLWKSDQKLAKFKENILISQFKTAFNAIIDQYTANKEKLLTFHDDRLKFIFTTKFEIALNRMETILMAPEKSEFDIREAIRQVLDLLMIRKKEILEERSADESLGYNIISALDKELSFIENSINNVFNKLEKFPQFKETIKQYLVMYLLQTYPRISFEKTIKNDNRVSEINGIISKYRPKTESDYESDDDQFHVHYDLGLHDKDQSNNFGKTGKKFIFDHEALEDQHGHKRLFMVVGGILGTVVLLLICASIWIMYHHRSTMFRYTQPDSQNQSKHMMKGFGQITSSAVSKDVINFKPYNVYENPTYNVVQTTLTTTPDILKQQANESIHENMALPLINS